MKNVLTFLIFLAAATAGFAQDLLVKKNGEELPVKIVELTPDMVKFKRFDNLDGPLISVLKSDVFMIKYENGVKDLLSGGQQATHRFSDPVPVAKPATANDPAPYQMKLGGPRFGLTYISNGRIARKLEEKYDATQLISQFGWQFETRIFSIDEGPAGLIEFVPMVGGLDQGLFLPSASLIIGLRANSGLELGFGPNFSAAGNGVVLALGSNFKAGNVNFPVNFAVVPSKDGARYSLIFGFNYRTRN